MASIFQFWQSRSNSKYYTFLIDVKCPDCQQRNVGMKLCFFCKPLIKSRQHIIIPMQNMEEMAAAALDACIEVGYCAFVFRLAMKRYSPFPNSLDHCFWIVLG